MPRRSLLTPCKRVSGILRDDRNNGVVVGHMVETKRWDLKEDESGEADSDLEKNWLTYEPE